MVYADGQVQSIDAQGSDFKTTKRCKQFCKLAQRNKLCTHPRLGPTAKELCPQTCGTCPSAPALATPACEDNDAAVTEQSGRQMKSCEAVGDAGLCNHEQIGPIAKEACPRTCGTCPSAAVAPAPSAAAPKCKDNDAAAWQQMHSVVPSCKSGSSRSSSSIGDVFFLFPAVEILGLIGPFEGPLTPQNRGLQYQMPQNLTLPMLNFFVAGDRNFLGPVPLVWQSSSLRMLLLQNTQIHGRIPQAFSAMTALEDFRIEEGRGLTGAFPSVTLLTALQYFEISLTSCNGTFGLVQNLPRLRRFALLHNKFSERGSGELLVSMLHCVACQAVFA